MSEKSWENFKDWQTWNWFVGADRSLWGCEMEWHNFIWWMSTNRITGLYSSILASFRFTRQSIHCSGQAGEQTGQNSSTANRWKMAMGSSKNSPKQMYATPDATGDPKPKFLQSIANTERKCRDHGTKCAIPLAQKTWKTHLVQRLWYNFIFVYTVPRASAC